MCWMSAHGVSGALGAQGRANSRPSCVQVFTKIVEDGGNLGVSPIWAVVLWWVEFLVQNCRCERNLLWFGSCRTIGFLEHAVRVVG